MTTTTKRRKAVPTPLDITLDELGVEIDTYLGRAVGVADAVRTYRHHADIATAHDSRGEHRQGIRAALSRAAGRGDTQINGKRLDRYVSGGGERRVLRSEHVKQRDSGLWLDSRVSATRLSLAAPTVTKIALPKVFGSAAAAWAALEASRAICSAAVKERDSARDVLRAVFAEASKQWAGDPLVTADGWQVGWGENLSFNATRCREMIVARALDAADFETVEYTPETVRFRLLNVAGEATDDDGE